MTLAKEADREKDAPRSREAIYLLLDLVSHDIYCTTTQGHNLYTRTQPIHKDTTYTQGHNLYTRTQSMHRTPLYN